MNGDNNCNRLERVGIPLPNMENGWAPPPTYWPAFHSLLFRSVSVLLIAMSRFCLVSIPAHLFDFLDLRYAALSVAGGRERAPVSSLVAFLDRGRYSPGDKWLSAFSLWGRSK